MKKSAKTLSVAVVPMAVIAVVALTGWFVHAQEEQQALQAAAGGPTPAVSTDALLAEGKRLKEQGDYVAALPLLQQALAQDPASEPAAILAGVCLEKQGQYQEALQYYLKATGENSGFRSTALYCSAVCYKELGDPAKALELLNLQKACDPIGKWTIKGAALKAELEGRREAEANQIVSQEQEAARLYRQARDLMKETKAKDPQPLAMFDGVLTDYPDTGAVFPALSQKAELLWHLDRYEEMCAAYAQLRDWIKQQPNLDKWHGQFRTMDCRVGWYRATQQLKELGLGAFRGEKAPPDRWEYLRLLCERCWLNADDPGMEAEARIMWVESYYHEGNQPATLQAAQQFIEQYDKEAGSETYRHEIAMARVFAGDALRESGQINEAFDQYRRVVQAHRQSAIFSGDILGRVLYRYWWALQRTGASKEDTEAVGAEIRSRFPGSGYVQCMDTIEAQEAQRNAR